MTSRMLVAGSSGQLGRPTFAALAALGHDVQGVTRRGRAGSLAADFISGEGVDAAVEGVHTLVHTATTNGPADLQMARHLVTAAVRAKVEHLVLISIVGIDQIPLGFYRDRLAIESIIERSGIPFTIQRATQFHSFIDRGFRVQRWSPVVFVPSTLIQPIAVEEVGARLAELANGPAQGRVTDIGGPQTRRSEDFYRLWRYATGGKKPRIPVHLPGKFFAAYDAGLNVVPGPAYGTSTFKTYLTSRYLS